MTKKKERMVAARAIRRGRGITLPESIFLAKNASNFFIDSGTIIGWFESKGFVTEVVKETSWYDNDCLEYNYSTTWKVSRKSHSFGVKYDSRFGYHLV